MLALINGWTYRLPSVFATPPRWLLLDAHVLQRYSHDNSSDVSVLLVAITECMWSKQHSTLCRSIRYDGLLHSAQYGSRSIALKTREDLHYHHTAYTNLGNYKPTYLIGSLVSFKTNSCNAKQRSLLWLSCQWSIDAGNPICRFRYLRQ